MKQKLGLACTLIRPPRLLLLDEPTAGVDPVSRRELWAIVYRLVRDKGERAVEHRLSRRGGALWCADLAPSGASPGTGTAASFSEPLVGHSHLVFAPGIPKRRLQLRLAVPLGVLDAIIQGEGVRVVTRDPQPPNLEDWGSVGGRSAPPRRA